MIGLVVVPRLLPMSISVTFLSTVEYGNRYRACSESDLCNDVRDFELNETFGEVDDDVGSPF